MLPAGTNVDGFVLLRVLGEGPLGVSWFARDARRNTFATVKLLREPSKHEFAKLVAAIKTTGSVLHPQVQAVLRSVQEPSFGALGIALEHIEGTTLERAEIDPRKLAHYLRWFEELAHVLAELHKRGLAHGGVKPSNVIITQEGELKVLDLVWSQLAAEPAAPVDDLRALASTFEKVVLKKLPSIPPVLARVKATTAEDLAKAIASARVALQDEETTDRNARALGFRDEQETVRVDVEPDEAPSGELSEESNASTTVPDADPPRAVSSLAVWGLVLLSTAALVVAMSAWWSKKEARAKASRTMIVADAPEPPRPVDQEPETAVRTVEYVDPIPVEEPDPALAKKPEPDETKKKRKRFEVACDEGDGDACFELGTLLKTETSPALAKRARNAFERACAFSRASGCVEGAQLAETSGSLDEASRLFKRACELGERAACENVLPSGDAETSTVP